ncbi:unnamed protein product [Ectocarpus sp. 12 AP-2014]
MGQEGTSHVHMRRTAVVAALAAAAGEMAVPNRVTFGGICALL